MPPRDPHAPAAPHGGAPVKLLKGSPFDSTEHAMQAAFVRRGGNLHPQSGFEISEQIPAGTIAVLVRDGERNPLGNAAIKLKGVRRDIEGGDKEFAAETTADAEGRAAFRDQNTDSAFVYEILTERDGATYTSGSFSFDHDKGVIASLFVFPVTTRIEDAFVFSRALYAVEPRTDVFQIQALFRFHNASGASWRATDFPIVLPQGAKAFQPGNAVGVKMREENGRVLLNGTISPGQQEMSFGYQLPNEREEHATLAMALPPNLVDARVIVETSSRMGLVVPGFEPATKATTPSGQGGLLAQQDFLEGRSPRPSSIQAQISGLPPKSNAALYAVGIAGVIALLGLGFVFSRENRQRAAVAEADRRHACRLLLDELVALERAYKSEQIGPRTYEQTKRILLDSIARLGLTPPEPVAADPAPTKAAPTKAELEPPEPVA
jgi:hypothetical protein